MQKCFGRSSNHNTLGEEDTEFEESEEDDEDFDEGDTEHEVADTTDGQSAVKPSISTQEKQTDPPRTSWINLLKDNKNQGKGLQLQMFDNLPEEAVLGDLDVDDIESSWGYCLVGHVGGRFLE